MVEGKEIILVLGNVSSDTSMRSVIGSHDGVIFVSNLLGEFNGFFGDVIHT